jgi:hypothetical protein
MSDFSIVNYLENHKHQSVCGRFNQDQLDKTYLLAKPHHQLFHFDLRAVALGLALSTFSALPSQAQNSVGVQQHNTATAEPASVKQGEIAVFYDHRDEKFVGGKIQFDGKESSLVKITLLNGASAELTSVKPAKNGTFKIPLDWAKEPVSIRVSSPGYGSQTVYFSNHESLANLTITLYEKKEIKMGKVVSH